MSTKSAVWALLVISVAYLTPDVATAHRPIYAPTHFGSRTILGYDYFFYFPPPCPVLVQNPYVSPLPADLPGVACACTAPLRIINPYAVHPNDPSISPDAVMPRRPKVIYPTKGAKG